MKLYEIAEEYQKMLTFMEAYEMDEETIQNTLATIQDDADQKIDNIVSLIKDLTGDVKALKDEAAALTDRAKAKQNNIDRLKQYLTSYLPQVGYEHKAFENNHHKVSWRKSNQVEIMDGFLDWAQKNDSDLLRYKDPEPDKTAIKDALTAGKVIPFAQIVEKNNMQIK